MIKEKTIYDELGEERKILQERELLPDWMTTVAWQLLKEKYLTEQLQDAKKQLDGITFTTKNPQDITSINNNVELMSKMFNPGQAEK